MARMFKTMRQENETVIRLGGICPGDKLNAGLLLAGKQNHQDASEMFACVGQIDNENEHRPETQDVPHVEAREFADDVEDK